MARFGAPILVSHFQQQQGYWGFPFSTVELLGSLCKAIHVLVFAE